jgi:hypothetical protein
MSVIGNMKSLTTDVGSLIKQIKELRKEVKGLSGDAKTAMGNVKGVTGHGGQLTLGESQTGNSMSTSFGNMPDAGGRRRGGPTDFLSAGMARFSSNNYNTAAFMSMSANSSMMKASMAGAAVTGGLQMLSAPYQMTMDSSGIVNRAASYYQSTLMSPGMTRKGVEAATFKALRGGITEIGGDAMVSSILSASGYSANSKNYLGAAAQVGGAALGLGMGNQQASTAIAGLQSGKFAANAYQYGITTMDANGKYKRPDEIARQIMQTFSSGQKFTAKGIQESYLKGNLQPILEGLGLSGDQQQIIRSAMVDIASGKNPDLASKTSKSGGPGNENPLDAAMRINSSQTGIQMASEANTLKGLAGAAATVETFNRNMEGMIVSMATFKGYLDGISGTNVGKGAKSGLSGLKKIGGVGLMLAGAAVTGMSFGAATPIGLGMAGVGASMAFGGGAPGYGGSFGGSGAKGGGNPKGASANWMDKGDVWSSTGGTHLGTDYPALEGTPVFAKGDGVVSNDSISSDYGNAVLITHNDGYQTLYAHLKSKDVSPGDLVRKDQAIGKVGKSGNATGPHLHYEVRKGKNNPVNPSAYGDGSSPLTQSAMGAAVAMMMGGMNTASNSTSSSSSTSGSATTYAMGSEDQKAWATEFLTKTGAPVTESNLIALTTWMKAEGKGWSTSLNRATYNPLNTTLDMPGAVSFNSVGVKAYTSPEQGMQAIISTLTGKSADARGYTAILDAFKKGDNVDAALSAIDNSAWRAGKDSLNKGGYNFKGGGNPGYGASTPLLTPNQVSTPVHLNSQPDGAQTVNITVKFDQANEQNAEIFAKRVQKILEKNNHRRKIGAN